MADLEARLQALLPTAFGPAIARALNRAAVTAQGAMVRAVANDLGARQTDIKAFIRIHNATPDRQEARVYAFGRGIPFIKLNASGPEPSRGRPGGVQVRGVTYPHAFIATMPSGHRGVFERKGTARLPIRELTTASTWAEFKKFRDVGLAVGQVALRTNLTSELRYALLRQGLTG